MARARDADHRRSIHDLYHILGISRSTLYRYHRTNENLVLLEMPNRDGTVNGR